MSSHQSGTAPHEEKGTIGMRDVIIKIANHNCQLHNLHPNFMIYMIPQTLFRRQKFLYPRFAQMISHLSNGISDGVCNGIPGVSLQDLPKSSTFTANLPTDPAFKTPSDSHKAPREELGPRMVRGALYTYVRPEETQDPELLSVSRNAMNDIGLKEGEECSKDFKDMVAGNKIFWDVKTEEGIYPWAQCYGGI